MTPARNAAILNLFFMIYPTINQVIANTIYENVLYIDISKILSKDVFIKYVVKNGPENISIIFLNAFIIIISSFTPILYLFYHILLVLVPLLFSYNLILIQIILKKLIQ